jgi:hypothetical protein
MVKNTTNFFDPEFMKAPDFSQWQSEFTKLFGDFGKLDGQISDITARGFLLELAMTQLPLAVGACVGRVVRHLPNGIAVKFVEQQTVRDLDRMVARSVSAAAKAEVDLPEPVAVLRTATG